MIWGLSCGSLGDLFMGFMPFFEDPTALVHFEGRLAPNIAQVLSLWGDSVCADHDDLVGLPFERQRMRGVYEHGRFWRCFHVVLGHHESFWE